MWCYSCKLTRLAQLSDLVRWRKVCAQRASPAVSVHLQLSVTMSMNRDNFRANQPPSKVPTPQQQLQQQLLQQPVQQRGCLQQVGGLLTGPPHTESAAGGE
jgi:hypothetical protein